MDADDLLGWLFPAAVTASGSVVIRGVFTAESRFKKSGRLPCSERWWPFSWCWAAQGFSNPKRGPRMDPFRHLSGWNCDWRTQVAVTVPSWKVAIARLAADTSYCGKNWVTMISGIIGSL